RRLADRRPPYVHAHVLAVYVQRHRRRQLDARNRDAVLSARRGADSMDRANASLAHLARLHRNRAGVACHDGLLLHRLRADAPVHDPDAAAGNPRRIRRRDFSRSLARSTTATPARRLDLDARRDSRRHVLHEHLLVTLRLLGRSAHPHLLAHAAWRLFSVRGRGCGASPADRPELAGSTWVVSGWSKL